MTRRLLAALGLLLGVLLLPASPAAAFDLKPGSCAEAPTPSDPNNGAIQGWRFERGVPPQADPFAPHATATIFEQYGPAQFTFHLVPSDPDTACLIQAPVATITLGLANAGEGLMEIGWQAVAELAHYGMAPEEWTRYIDPLVIEGVQVTHDAVWTPYAATLYLLVAIIVMLKLVAYGHHAAHRVLLGVGAITTAVVVVVTAPLWIPQNMDSLLTEAARTAITAGRFYQDGGSTPANPGEQIAGASSDALLFDQWCMGQLGTSSTSDLGKTYCARLFKDQALTWAEANLDDPTRKSLIETKQADWKAAWKEIGDKYPANLEFGRGDHSGDAFTAVVMMYVGSIGIWIIVGTGLLVLLGAYLVVRLACIGVPVYGTLGLLPAARKIAWSPFRWILIALVNVLGWFTGVIVDARMVAAVLSPDIRIPPGVKMLMVMLLTAFLWVALRPLRRFTRYSMGIGDPAENAGQSWRTLKRLVGMAGVTFATAGAGAALGAAAASSHHREEAGEDDHSDAPDGEDITVAAATGATAGAAVAAVPGGGYRSDGAMPAQRAGSSPEVYDDGTVPDDGSVRWEQVYPHAPEPVRVEVEVGLEVTGALPPGTGVEGVVTFHDSTGGSGATPVDLPATDGTVAVQPAVLPEEGAFVFYDPISRTFATRGADGETS